MDYKALRQILSETDSALAEHRLTDALALVESILHSLADSNRIDSLYALRQNYEALLRFTFASDSIPDQSAIEGVNEQACQLVRKLVMLLNAAVDIWLETDRSSAIGRKSYVIHSTSHQPLLQLLNKSHRLSETSEEFFRTVDAAASIMWLLPVDAKECGDSIVRHPSIFAQQLFASSLTCGLLVHFDTQKLSLLLRLHSAAVELMADDATRMVHKGLMARTLVGLVIVYLRYRTLLAFFPELHHEVVAAIRQSSAEMPALWTALLRASVTSKVNEQVDSILPELKEAVEQHLMEMGDGKKGELVDSDGESVFDNKMMDRVTGHAIKIDTLRREGFDVNYISATNLKRFDFFREAVHWLYPFSISIPWVHAMLHDENGQLDKATLGIMHHSYFCESDCYSYLAMMQQVDTRQNGGSDIVRRMRKELSEIGDVLYDETFLNQPLNLYTNYVQSLFRLLRLQPEGKDLYDPFASDVRILSLDKIFAETLTDDVVVDAAKMLIRMGEHESALSILSDWQQNNGSSDKLLAQMGYAYMQTRQWEQALQAFSQSLLINDEQPDLLVLQARCHQALGQWQRALDCLLRHEASHADDPSALRAVGSCLIRLEKWDEAAQRFFKLEFLGHATAPVRRSIAWCLLRQGKYERAETYYRGLCSGTSVHWEDQLNLSHTLLLLHRQHDALEAYRHFVKLYTALPDDKRPASHWSELMTKDYDTFLAAHYPRIMWPLLIDSVGGM